ncbi:uncharacterized protein LOC143888705 [Tasmannia lanceolata]|uniref:uncharacterized protein LOC143888705 n=1 Tax=Tasmannia lanceolata TaxID=3420 RepID=UPI004063537A
MDLLVIVDPFIGMTSEVRASTTPSASSSSHSPSLAPVENSYPQLNIAKFDGANYLPWKVAIETYLLGWGKSMTPAIYSTLILLPTAKEIWNHTALTYSGVENLTRICSTYSEWMRLRRGDMSLEAHYGQFISLCQQIDVFLPLTSDVNVLRRQREQIRVVHYLESLGPEFTHLRHKILGSGNIPSLHEANSRAQQCLGETPSRLPSNSFALAAYDGGSSTHPPREGGSFWQARGRGCVGSGYGRLYCTHCQRDGHVIETWYTLHPELRPPRSAHLTTAGHSDTVFPAPTSTSADDSFTFTRADYEELQRLRQSASQATTGFAQPGSSPTTLLSSSGSWIIDSGASNHMTGNTSQLSSFHSFPYDFQSMTLADGSTTPITGIGTTCPSPHLPLSSVLIIRLGGRMDRDMRWMAFTALTAVHLLQLYIVKWMPFSSTVNLCQSCEFRKHHRVSLPSRVVSRVDSLFQLVHSDVYLLKDHTQKGYRCSSPHQCRWFVSSDVTFFESEPFFGSTSVPLSSGLEPEVSISLPDLPASSPAPLPPSSACPLGWVKSCVHSVDPPPIKFQYQRRQQQALHPHSERSSSQAEIPLPFNQVSSSPVVVSDSPIDSRTRSHSTVHPISNFVCYDLLTPAFKSFVLCMSSVVLPQSLDEALNDPGWRAAMDLEMGTLHSNQTWALVSLPVGARPVGCCWVFSIKYLPDGTVERLKARQVAKGYIQTFSVNYNETFSPVAKIPSVGVLLSLAVNNGWHLHQLDVKNAFLHGDLLEEVYMEKRPGYVAQGELSSSVCRLRKSLYGLKQSP